MNFWLSLLQEQRRVDLQGTIEEMAKTSAIIYGIPSLTILLALSLPTWEGIDKPLIYLVVAIGLVIASIFFIFRKSIPLWLALGHVPLGILLVGVGMYGSGGNAGVIVAALYVMSSTYAYHFFTPLTGGSLIIFSAIVFASIAQVLGIEGWLALSLISLGCSFTAGIIIHMLVQRIHKLATVDSLTGLYNRQTWDMFFAQQMALAERSGKSFQIMLIDLNDFKIINDQKGHLYGDRVLHRVGLALRNSVRAVDHVARWGGDEFIILFPEQGKEALSLVCTRLQKELVGVISFSVGSAAWEAGDTVDSLLSRADLALYRDKQERKKLDVAGVTGDVANQPA